MKKPAFILITLVFMFMRCDREARLPYLDPSLSFEERADDLVSRMTLEEKVSQMVYGAAAIERLGIPEYNWWNECLHGVARAGKATVFPQAIALAAMWDTAAMSEMAKVTADEARAKYNEFQRKGKRGIYQGLTFWSPNINIFRDPRWGRGMETYGEDPFLTGRMAVAFIKGLQGNDPQYMKVVATAKHYVVHSGPEPDRHSFDAVVSERDFRDTYLPAFRASILEGKAYSVMCAYNRYLGEPCCGSSYILQDILRDELGFDGYVVSDCWAINDFFDGHNVVSTPQEAAAMAVKAGTDLNCGNSYPSLVDAVSQGLIGEEELDVSVKRLMMARLKLGMFDPAEKVPFNRIPYEMVNSKSNEKLAADVAKKSMVLLKNENNTLPFANDGGTIAVIGPNANDVEVLLGNYNGTPYNPVTPLRGIREKVNRNTTVLYAPGCEHAEGLPILETIPAGVLLTSEKMDVRGLQAEMFPNLTFGGSPVASQVHDTIDFNWWEGTPHDALKDDNFGVRWTGYLVPPVSGRYVIGAEARDFKLFIADEQIASYHSEHHAVKRYAQIDLEAGKAYPVKLDFTDFHGDATVRLLWSVPGRQMEKEALEIAQKADKIVLFMGLSPRLEGEEMRVNVEGFHGGDRLSLDLPKLQQELIKKIHALGKPTVLVLLNGSALSINWEAKNIPAILEAWYPGQAAGNAIADILFGDYNPAGRLPVTFYKSVDQLPPFDDYNMKGKTYRYFEKEVLYPFGYGLSYTTFSYSNLRIENNDIASGGTATVSVDVTNTGNINGEEVVQLYLSYPESYKDAPLKDLRGFARVNIPKGATQTVSFTLKTEQLEYYHTGEKKYLVEPGTYAIMVGTSSDDKSLLRAEMEVAMVNQ